MADTRILVVDDEEEMLEVYADTLRKLPRTETVLERQSQRAAERLGRESFDLLISDVCMPGTDGVNLLRQARQHDPRIAAVMVTAYPTVETAVECMKLGAVDYVAKPFLPDDLMLTVRRLLEGKWLRDENRMLRRQMERAYAFGDIVGKGAAMKKVFEAVERVAATDFDVLIAGETGTGKELVARAIHQRSGRKDGPFVPVDSGAIPEELMESELFGHERGAYTGAQSRGLGLMELADGGTFFLDEVGHMPLRLQAKMLRVLQERRIRRVGGAREIEIDVRIVAASSRDLDKATAAEQFRRDFFHRINVVRIELPPLRERAEDIPLLIEHFVRRYAAEMEKGPVQVDPEAAEVLASYSWPGNVRELQNALKRALTMAGGQAITLESLPPEIVERAGDRTLQETGFFALRDRRVRAFEKEYLSGLLCGCRGEVSCAAREARLPRGTLYRLLKKHGLDPADFRGVEGSWHI